MSRLPCYHAGPCFELILALLLSGTIFVVVRCVDSQHQVFNGRNDPALYAVDRDLLHNLFQHEGIESELVDRIFVRFCNDVPGVERVDLRDVCNINIMMCVAHP